MALESNNLRDALKPQDIVAGAIMLLGVMIAVFLDDAIIKLIGGSIAVLGFAALYMAIRSRMTDRVKLQNRRTALAPPTFKTRVAHDSGTNTKRIVFDDFHQQYAAEDAARDDEAIEPEESIFTPIPPKPSPRPITSAAPLASMTPRSLAEDAEDEEEETFNEIPVGGAGGSFRVIGTVKHEEPVEETQVAEPVADEPPKRRIDTAATMTPVIELPDLEESVVQQPEPVRPEPLPEPPVIETPQPTAETATAPVPTPTHATPKRVQMILEDLVSGNEDENAFNESRAEFIRLIAQLLNAIARSVPARSIAYFWVNLDKGHYIPEAAVSGDTMTIRLGEHLPIGEDILSQIARGRAAEILTDINPAAERELLPYYSTPAGTRSFVGVPIFFQREVVGVLTADSTEADAFDESAVASLAEYTRLITGLIRSYTEKYDLQLNSRALHALEDLNRAFIGARLTPLQTGEKLIEYVTELVDASYIAVVLFDPAKMQWTVPFSISDIPMATVENNPIDLEGSLSGRATQYAEEICIESVNDQIRFSPSEQLPQGGTFIALPLVGISKCYGALTLEHHKPSAYLRRDIDLLRTLARCAAMAIESYALNQIVETSVALDATTGLYTSEFLIDTLQKEIRRSNDLTTPVCFTLISPQLPDSVRSYADASTLDAIVRHQLSKTIGEFMRVYDTAGSYSEDGTFGVVLPGKNDQDAYLWSERLRKEVASRILTVGQRTFSITVSIGVCQADGLANISAVLDGTLQALDRARSNDGNSVVVY